MLGGGGGVGIGGGRFHKMNYGMITVRKCNSLKQNSGPKFNEYNICYSLYFFSDFRNKNLLASRMFILLSVHTKCGKTDRLSIQI